MAVMDRWRALTAALAAGVVAGSPAAASTFVVGADAPSQNCAPFGCARTGHPTRYQQVYAADAFDGPLAISGLVFYENEAAGPGVLNQGVFHVRLATTSTKVDELNPFDFDANVGARLTPLFDGVLPSLQGGLLTLNFTQAFDYDPSVDGNLLLDVTYEFVFKPFETPDVYFHAFTGDAGGITSRVSDFVGGEEGFGLTTGFVTAAAVPEPATWAMMIVGFGGVGLLIRRRTPALARA